MKGWGKMARKYSKRQSAEQLALGDKVERTALYIRVSTERQAEEGYSLDAQATRLGAYCQAQGWDVESAHVFVDAGVSGKSTDREQFQAMMDAAQRGDITRIVAMKLDRIARNTKDFLAIVDALQAHGCDLVLIKESFDTSTPQGKFFMTMSAAMAEFEASTITERVMSGKAQKAQDGGYNGARCPLGYSYDQGVFSIVEEDAATVRYIFAAFAAGDGMKAIADGLNLTATPTARGGAWYASTVRTILQNGFYAGLSQWDGVETIGSHPAIISRDLYELAHSRLKALKPGPLSRPM
jgi:site-specific DNA recombinase